MVDDEAARSIRALVARGALGAGVMETDDCRRTYQELGVEAVFRGLGELVQPDRAEGLRSFPGRRYRIVLVPAPVTSPAYRVINLA